MPSIAHEALLQRIQRTGLLDQLQSDFKILMDLRVEFVESLRTPVNAGAPPSKGVRIPLRVGVVRLGHLVVRNELDKERAKSVKRLLDMAVESTARRLLQEAASSSDRALPGAVSKAVRMIRSNFREPLRLGLVAAEIGVSPEGLSRLFHGALGITFSEYLNQIRLDHCREALRRTQKPITEIAFEHGFQSISQFNRRFKTAEEMSPSQYRIRFNGS